MSDLPHCTNCDQLRAENRRLREALEAIAETADDLGTTNDNVREFAYAAARAALSGVPVDPTDTVAEYEADDVG